MVINRKQTNNRKGAKLFIVSTCILILLILITIFSSNIDSNIEKGVINLPNKVDAQKMVNNKVEKGMFRVFINTNINIGEDNKARLLIENNDTNAYNVFIEVVEEHSNKKLYKSDIVKPGYKIESDIIKLTTGKYDCTAYFHIIDNDKNNISKIEIPITITKE